MAALTLELEILQADPGLVLSVRVGDVLDARRDAIRVVFRLHGPGRYAASLDLPDHGLPAAAARVGAAPEDGGDPSPPSRGSGCRSSPAPPAGSRR